MKLRATQRGFYQGTLIEPGQVFEYKGPFPKKSYVPAWTEKVSDKAPVDVEEPAAQDEPVVSEEEEAEVPVETETE